VRILQPEGWAQPKGFANGIEAEGRFVFVAGQVGWNAQCEFESDNLVEQIRQTFKNIIAVLNEANAGPEHITRMTWYVVDKCEYLANTKEIGNVYRELLGRHFPAMTLVEVAGLLEERAKVEIEVTAVV